MSLPLALILEDDPKLAELYETRNIDSGREAQKILETLSPKLIVLDIHLPYVSGMELLEQIKVNKRLKDATIVVMTADIYTAKELKNKFEHVLLKTHGITNLR